MCHGVTVFPGLGWIDGQTVRFSFDNGQKRPVPHMGWNEITIDKDSKILAEMFDQPRFYFVHSYHLQCNDQHDVLCSSTYGYSFTSALERENIVGVQFHPEKSHKFGMQLLKNFAELY